MTDETNARGRAQRRHYNQSVCRRQSKLNKIALLNTVEKAAPVSSHRFNKKKALNCGIPSCGLCSNPRKLLGNSREALSTAEKSAFQKRLFAADSVE